MGVSGLCWKEERGGGVSCFLFLSFVFLRNEKRKNK